MPTNIDDRIVRMQFQNSDFEKGVKETIQSLEELKTSLNFKEAEKGLQDLQRAGDSFSLTRIAETVDDISNRFTLLGRIGTQVMDEIASRVIGLGKSLMSSVKMFSFDQIGAGFDKYASKTSSVQQIVNATGKSIDEVNAQLDKLVWFTDETSYSFTDMVNSIGKFTSVGADLGESVTAMQGIATWAALSGGNTREASIAMYNLSQSMGMGFVNRNDWKSISLANMSTKEFKKTAIETGKALGVLNKEGYNAAGHMVTISSFEESLKDQWFTKDVLLAVLGQYGEFADKAYALIEEGKADDVYDAMKQLEKEYGTLGYKAFRAAQEAKTFNEVITATTDAVSSKWMTIWEAIFGNYEEAKVIWTDAAEYMYTIFADPLDALADTFSDWHILNIGGYEDLVSGLEDIASTIVTIIEELRNAFYEIIPQTTVDQLMNASLAIKQFGATFKQTFSSIPKVISANIQRRFNSFDILNPLSYEEEEKKYSELDRIRLLQMRMIKAGYDLGTEGVTGELNANTMDVFIQLQKDAGISAENISTTYTEAAHEAVIKILNERKEGIEKFDKALKKGAKGEEVKLLQQRLKELGLYKGNIDGIFGPQTEAAVKDLQKQAGKTGKQITGIYASAEHEFLGTKILSGPQQALAEYNRELKKGARGEDVKKLQQHLKDLGLYDGAIDGIFGPKTEAGLKKFEKNARIASDGIYDEFTHKKMVEALFPDEAFEHSNISDVVYEEENQLSPALQVLADITKGAAAVIDLLGQVLGFVKDLGVELGKTLAPVAMLVVYIISKLASVLVDINNWIRESGLFDTILSAVRAVLGPIQKAFEVISGIVGYLFGWVFDIVRGAAHVIIDPIVTIISKVPQAVENIKAFFKSFGFADGGEVEEASNVLNTVLGLFEMVRTFLLGGEIEGKMRVGLFTRITKFLQGDLDGLIEGLDPDKQQVVIGLFAIYHGFFISLRDLLIKIVEAAVFLFTGKFREGSLLNEDSPIIIFLGSVREKISQLFTAIKYIFTGQASAEDIQKLGTDGFARVYRIRKALENFIKGIILLFTGIEKDTNSKSTKDSKIIKFAKKLRKSLVKIIGVFKFLFTGIHDKNGALKEGGKAESFILKLRHAVGGFFEMLSILFGGVVGDASKYSISEKSIDILTTIRNTVGSIIEAILYLFDSSYKGSNLNNSVAEKLDRIRAWISGIVRALTLLIFGNGDGSITELTDTEQSILELHENIVGVFNSIEKSVRDMITSAETLFTGEIKIDNGISKWFKSVHDWVSGLFGLIGAVLGLSPAAASESVAAARAAGATPSKELENKATLEQKLIQFATTIHNFFAGIKTGFENAIKDINAIFGNGDVGDSELKSPIITWLRSVYDWFDGIFNTIGSILGLSTSNASNSVAAARANGATPSEHLQQRASIQGKIDSFIEDVKGFFENVKSKFENGIEKIKEIFSEGIPSFGESVVEWFNGVGDWFTLAIGAVGRVFGFYPDNAAKSVAAARAAGAIPSQELSDQATLENKVTNFINSITAFFTNIKTELKEGIETIKGKFENGFDETVNTVAGWFGGVKEWFANIFKTIAKILGIPVSEPSEAVESGSDSSADEALAKKDEIKEKSESFGSRMEAFFTTIKGNFEAAIEKVKGAFKDGFTVVGDTITGWFESAKEWFAKIFRNIATILGIPVSGSSEESEASSDSSDDVLENTDELVEESKTYGSDLEKILTVIKDNIAKAIGNLIAKVGEKFKVAEDTVTGWFESAKEWFANILKNIASILGIKISGSDEEEDSSTKILNDKKKLKTESKSFADNMLAFIEVIRSNIEAGIKKLNESFGNEFKAGSEKVKEWFDKAKEWFAGLFRTIAAILGINTGTDESSDPDTKILNEAGSISDKADGFTERIKSFFENIKGIFDNAIAAVEQIFVNGFTVNAENAPAWFESVAHWFSVILDTIANILGLAPAKAEESDTDLSEELSKTADIENKSTTFVASITAFFKRIRETFHGAIGFIEDLFTGEKTPGELVINWFNGICDWISGIFVSIANIIGLSVSGSQNSVAAAKAAGATPSKELENKAKIETAASTFATNMQSFFENIKAIFETLITNVTPLFTGEPIDSENPVQTFLANVHNWIEGAITAILSVFGISASAEESGGFTSEDLDSTEEEVKDSRTKIQSFFIAVSVAIRNAILFIKRLFTGTGGDGEGELPVEVIQWIDDKRAWFETAIGKVNEFFFGKEGEEGTDIISRSASNLETFKNNVIGFFENLIGTFGDIFASIKYLFTGDEGTGETAIKADLKEKLSPFQKVIDAIMEFFELLIGGTERTENSHFTEDGRKRLLEFRSTLLEWAGNIGDFWGKLLGINFEGSAEDGEKAGNNIKLIFDVLTGFFTTIAGFAVAGFIGRVANWYVTTGFFYDWTAKFVKIALAIALLAGAVWLVGNVADAKTAIGLLIGMLVAFYIFIKAYFELQKSMMKEFNRNFQLNTKLGEAFTNYMTSIGTFFGALLGLILGLALIGFLVKKEVIGLDSLLIGLGLVVVLALVIGGIYAVLGKMFKDLQMPDMSGISEFGKFVAILSFVMIIMGMIATDSREVLEDGSKRGFDLFHNPEALWSGLGFMALTLFTISLLYALLMKAITSIISKVSGEDPDKFKTVAEALKLVLDPLIDIMKALVPIMVVSAIIGKLTTWDDIGRAALLIIATTGGLALLLFAVSKMENLAKLKGDGVAKVEVVLASVLAAVAGVIFVLGYTIGTFLGDTSWELIGAFAGALVVVLAGMAIILTILGKFKVENLGSIEAVLWSVVGAMALLILAFSLIFKYIIADSVSPELLDSLTGVLTVLMGALAVIAGAMGYIAGKFALGLNTLSGGSILKIVGILLGAAVAIGLLMGAFGFIASKLSMETIDKIRKLFGKDQQSEAESFADNLEGIGNGLTSFLKTSKGMSVDSTIQDDVQTVKDTTISIKGLFDTIAANTPKGDALTTYNEQLSSTWSNIDTLGTTMGTFKDKIQGMADSTITEDTKSVIKNVGAITGLMTYIGTQAEAIEKAKKTEGWIFTREYNAYDDVLDFIGSLGENVGSAGEKISGYGTDESTFRDDVNAAISVVLSAFNILKEIAANEAFNTDKGHLDFYDAKTKFDEMGGSLVGLVETVVGWADYLSKNAGNIDFEQLSYFTTVLDNLSSFYKGEEGYTIDDGNFLGIKNLNSATALADLQVFVTNVISYLDSAIGDFDTRVASFNAAGQKMIDALGDGFNISINSEDNEDLESVSKLGASLAAVIDDALAYILDEENGKKQEFYDEGKALIDEMGRAIGDSTSISDAIKEIFKGTNLFKGINHKKVAEEAGEELQEIVDDTPSVHANDDDEYDEYMDENLEDMFAGYNDAMAGVNSQITDGNTLLYGEDGKGGEGTLMGSLTTFTNGFGEIKNTLGMGDDQLGGILTSTKSSMTQITTILTGEDGVVSQFTSLTTSFTGEGGVLASMKTLTGPDGIGAVITEINGPDGMVTKMNSLYDTVSGELLTSVTTLTGPDGFGQITTLINGPGGMMSSISTITDGFTGENGLQGMVTTLMGSNGIGSITSMLTGKNGLGGSITTLTSTFTSEVSGPMKEFTSQMSSIMHPDENLEDGGSNFLSYFTSYSDALIGDENSLSSGIDELMGGIDGEGGLVDKSTALGESLGNLVDTGSEAFSTIGFDNEHAFTTGANFIEAIIAGMKSKQAGADTASADIATEMVNTFNSTVSSTSPLFVLELVRSYLTILNELLNDGFEANPIVTPVVDMSNANKAAGSLNTLFGNTGFTLGPGTTILVKNTADSVEENPVNTTGTTLDMIKSELESIRTSIDGLSNDGAVEQIGIMASNVGAMVQAVGNMDVVLDTGALVGGIAQPMSVALAEQESYGNRGV